MIKKIENLEKNTNLVTLNLANNAINSIENIGHLQRLNTLNLSGNLIK